MTNEGQGRRRILVLIGRYEHRADEIRARHHEQAAFDHAFDAGEWSGPAIWRAEQRELDALAQECGFASAEVLEDCAMKLRIGQPKRDSWGGWSSYIEETRRELEARGYEG